MPRPGCSATPTAAATAPATEPGSLIGASSTIQAPSSYSAMTSKPTWTARRVFPTPPGPTIVSTPVAASEVGERRPFGLPSDEARPQERQVVGDHAERARRREVSPAGRGAPAGRAVPAPGNRAAGRSPAGSPWRPAGAVPPRRRPWPRTSGPGRRARPPRIRAAWCTASGDVAVAAGVGLAGVQADAHADVAAGRPRVGGQRPLTVQGRGDGVPASPKAISSASPSVSTSRPEWRATASRSRRRCSAAAAVVTAQAVEETGGPLDVRHQEGDRSRGERRPRRPVHGAGTGCAARRNATPGGWCGERPTELARATPTGAGLQEPPAPAAMSIRPTSRPSSSTGRWVSDSSSIRSAASATEVPGWTTAGRLQVQLVDSRLVEVAAVGHRLADVGVGDDGDRRAAVVGGHDQGAVVRPLHQPGGRGDVGVRVHGRRGGPHDPGNGRLGCRAWRLLVGVPDRSRPLCAHGTEWWGSARPDLRSDHVRCRPGQARPRSS